MLTYDMEQRGKEPRYTYLYRRIKEDVLSGKLKAKTKLPSKRELASHLAVSVVTVQNAYELLLSEGFITASERSGYFVSDAKYFPVPKTEARELKPSKIVQEVTWKYDFASNRIGEKYFPFSVWSRLMRQTLSEGGEELLRVSPNTGMPALREAISDYLSRERGIFAPPENIVVGAGTEYLYGLILQLLGKDKVYGVETPSYKKIKAVYASGGVLVKDLVLDKAGVEVKQLYRFGVNVLHLSPSHHYPTGIVTGFKRRTELLSWADEANGYIVEDDYDSEFRYIGKPVSPMQALDKAGRVIYVNTFSKTLAPSMRISYMVLPSVLMEEFQEKLGFYSCTVPNFEQLTLAKFISGGYFERHLSRMRNVYRKKRDEAMALFLNCGYPVEISEENAGLHFLVKLHTDKSDEEVRALAEEKGVKLLFLSDFADGDKEAYAHRIVVNYSGL